MIATCSTHGLAVRDIRQKYSDRKYKKNGTHQPDDLAGREALLYGLAKQNLCNDQQSQSESNYPKARSLSRRVP